MNKIGFILEKINTDQFAIIENSFDSSNDNYGIETNIGFGIDFENKGIMSSVEFQFVQDKNPFIVVKASCEFHIEEDFWTSIENKEFVTLPKEFMAHLSMITVGTTRGILHSKTENTKFNDYILPTINVAEMFKEDGVFPKD